MAEQFFQAGTDLETLRLKGLDFSGKAGVFLPQALYQRDRLLDAFFKMPQGVDFRFVYCHRRHLLACVRERSLHLPGDLRELGFVRGSGFGEDFTVQSEARQLQPVHKCAVGETGGARCGADTNDPKRTEIAFLALAAGIGELERALDGFLRGTVQLALG